MTSTTSAARQTVAAQLATLGVKLPARLIEVKGGKVRKVYLTDEHQHRAVAAAELLGGTVSPLGAAIIL